MDVKDIKEDKCSEHGMFGEQYTVKFRYQRPDGYWVYGAKANVVVAVKHGVNEKDNHERAATLVLNAYPNCNCKINSVIYC